MPAVFRAVVHITFRFSYLPSSVVHIFAQLHSFLKAKDSWGRTVVAHAVLSGRSQVFDAVFEALKEEVRDSEVGHLG